MDNIEANFRRYKKTRKPEILDTLYTDLSKLFSAIIYTYYFGIVQEENIGLIVHHAVTDIIVKIKTKGLDKVCAIYFRKFLRGYVSNKNGKYGSLAFDVLTRDDSVDVYESDEGTNNLFCTNDVLRNIEVNHDLDLVLQRLYASFYKYAPNSDKNRMRARISSIALAGTILYIDFGVSKSSLFTTINVIKTMGLNSMRKG
jgi:hypothetical protein